MENNEIKKGKLIAIEGLDCCFKETNSIALYENLKNMFGEDKVCLYSFPRYNNDASTFVSRFLQGKYGTDINPNFICDFYSFDRYDAWLTEIKEQYINGKIIICDRYTLSNILYQSIRGKTTKIFNHVIEREFVEMGLPIPDLTIFMDMPFEIQKKMLAEKKNKDINEMNFDFLESVYNNKEECLNLFRDLNKKILWCNNPKIEIVNCTANGIIHLPKYLADYILTIVIHHLNLGFINDEFKEIPK